MSQSVVPTPTIKMTGAATLNLDQVVQAAMPVVAAKAQARIPEHRIAAVTAPAHRLVGRTIDVATRNRRKADETTLARPAVSQIAGQTVVVRHHVDPMIDVVTRNRRKADETTLARPAVSPIAGQIVLDHRLVDLMIGDATSSRPKMEEVGSVRPSVVRAVVLVRRNMVPIATAVDSSRLIAAADLFPHIAVVMIVDAAVSGRRSVALITIEVA